ncbi:MAG: limonene-1,2-epoxide hydrolase family protein [Hyphomonadaceae bacterium]
MTPVETVEAFLRAYWSGDADGALSLASDDFQWLNVPMPKSLVDRAALAKLMAGDRGFPGPIESGGHVTLHALEAGDLVMHERVDEFVYNGVKIAIPCNAIWRVRDGRISLWKDYYDLGVYLRGMKAAGVQIDTSNWW